MIVIINYVYCKVRTNAFAFENNITFPRCRYKKHPIGILSPCPLFGPPGLFFHPANDREVIGLMDQGQTAFHWEHHQYQLQIRHHHIHNVWSKCLSKSHCPGTSLFLFLAFSWCGATFVQFRGIRLLVLKRGLAGQLYCQDGRECAEHHHHHHHKYHLPLLLLLHLMIIKSKLAGQFFCQEEIEYAHASL